MPHVTFTSHLRAFFPNLNDGDVLGGTVRDGVIEIVSAREPHLG